MKAFGYCRVSSKRQAVEGQSLDVQEKAFRAWCRAEKYEPVVFVEAKSAKAASKRPRLEEAVDAACAAGGAFVVYSLSRFARSLSHALSVKDRLVEAGVRFVSLKENADTGTPAGRFFFNIMLSMYEFELELNRERVSEMVEPRRANGQRLGMVPYGMRVEDDVLVPNDGERKVVRMMKRWRRSGESYRGVARRLNECSVPSRTGKGWTNSSVRSVLGVLRREVA